MNKWGEEYTCPQRPCLHVNNYAKGRSCTCNFSLQKTSTLGFTALHYRTHFAETISASSPTCSTHWPSYPSLSSQQQTQLLAISPLILSKQRPIMNFKSSYQYCKLSRPHWPQHPKSVRTKHGVFLILFLLPRKKKKNIQENRMRGKM